MKLSKIEKEMIVKALKMGANKWAEVYGSIALHETEEKPLDKWEKEDAAIAKGCWKEIWKLIEKFS